MATSEPGRRELIDFHAVADILGVDAWRAERIAKVAPGFPRSKSENPYMWDAAEVRAFAERRIQAPGTKAPLDPRISALIEAVRGLEPYGSIEVHARGLDMGGFHQVSVHQEGRHNVQLFSGRMRDEYAALLIAVTDAAGLIQEFLASHLFAEAYDEIRADNEQLRNTMLRILAELRRGGIFKT